MNKLFLPIKELYNKYIGDSSYKKNVLVMVGSRVLAQAIPILLTPLLTRIYSPEEFGIFGVFSTIVSLIAMVSNGRYCLSIILPKEKEKAQNLVIISTILTIVVTILFSAILLLTEDRFFSVLHVESLKGYFVLIILTILFVGLNEALFYYNLREKKYKTLATNVILQATALITVRLATGFLGFTSIGLILSYLVSYVVSFTFLIVKSDLKINWEIFKHNAKDLLSKYSKFPKFSLLSDSLSSLANNLPNILLNSIFGSTATGYFSISDKVLGSPIWFVTSSVGDVFKQEASEQYRNGGSCRNVFIKTSKTMFYIGVIPFIMIFLIVPYIVPFLFGDIWAPAGEYIRIFSIMYFSSFVVNPVLNIAYIVNKQQYAVLYQAIKLVSIVVAFVVGFYYHNLSLALILWSSLVTLTNIFIFFSSYKLAKISKYVDSVSEDTRQN